LGALISAGTKTATCSALCFVWFTDRISATGMETREITIRVDAEAAKAYAAAASEERLSDILREE
jgi:hypothetical protein